MSFRIRIPTSVVLQSTDGHARVQQTFPVSVDIEAWREHVTGEIWTKTESGSQVSAGAQTQPLGALENRPF